VRKIGVSAWGRVAGCLLAGGFAAATHVGAGTWCDVVFKDVAREADIVVLARVEQAKDGAPTVHVVDVLKGSCGSCEVRLDPEDLDGVKDGDRLFVALDRDHRPVRGKRSLGFCGAISVLPIRGGKLRSRDRLNYDSQAGGMTLDELREELSRELAAGSKSARLSAE
jgi:hypothetical protein